MSATVTTSAHLMCHNIKGCRDIDDFTEAMKRVRFTSEKIEVIEEGEGWTNVLVTFPDGSRCAIFTNQDEWKCEEEGTEKWEM